MHRALWKTLLVVMLMQAVAASAEPVGLSSLDLSKVRQGWKTAQVDRAVELHPLSIAGKKFAHGVGTHSPGAMYIALDGRARSFHAYAGIDDETGGRGSVTFTIVADGRVVWRTGVVRGGEPARGVDIDLKGVRLLALFVGTANDGFEFDHADWADAAIDTEGASPVLVDPPHSPDPVIATTPPLATPEIHIPEVAGFVPGSQVVLRVAATGTSPLTFRADGLPAGLALNPQTGVIQGGAPEEGSYRVRLQVSSSAGVAAGEMRFVSGDTLALTPPLGWNSYDSYGDGVTEAETLANAEYLHDHLQPYGWDYVVIDYRWYDPRAGGRSTTETGLAMDEFGRLQPAEDRFPSAAGGAGFKPLADRVHAMGLKFGIHIMRGMARQALERNTPIEGSSFHASDAADPNTPCSWNQDMWGVHGDTPAGQAWYDSIIRQYAQWGIDYIKMDDASQPYRADEIAAIHKAIVKSGRSIVLSLSPGEAPVDQALHVNANANLWRISGDFWDNWDALLHSFDLLDRWQGHSSQGHWPDADMIPLGHLGPRCPVDGANRPTRFTRQEQVTLMTLWSIAPSPMMLGMNLPDNDAWTLALLTNPEVMAVNQDPSGSRARRAWHSEDADVWVRTLADGSRAVALFNRGDYQQQVTAKWEDMGVSGKQSVRDLWRRARTGTFIDAYSVTLPPHGTAFLKFRNAGARE